MPASKWFTRTISGAMHRTGPPRAQTGQISPKPNSLNVLTSLSSATRLLCISIHPEQVPNEFCWRRVQWNELESRWMSVVLGRLNVHFVDNHNLSALRVMFWWLDVHDLEFFCVKCTIKDVHHVVAICKYSDLIMTWSSFDCSVIIIIVYNSSTLLSNIL